MRDGHGGSRGKEKEARLGKTDLTVLGNQKDPGSK